MGKIANGYITIVDLNDGVKYDILVSTANAVVNDTTGVVTYSCSGYLKSIKGKFTSNISNATIYLYADDTKVALVNTTSAGLFTFTLDTVSKSTANSLILRYYENNDTTKGLLASYTIPVSHNYNKTYSYIRYSDDGGQTFTAASQAAIDAAKGSLPLEGRNLVGGMPSFDGWVKDANWEVENGVATKTGAEEANWYGINSPMMDFSIIEGRTITVSFKAKGAPDRLLVALSLVNSIGVRRWWKEIYFYNQTSVDNYTTLSYTLIANRENFTNKELNAEDINTLTKFRLKFYRYSTEPISIKEVKLEVGTVATNYTPTNIIGIEKAESNSWAGRNLLANSGFYLGSSGWVYGTFSNSGGFNNTPKASVTSPADATGRSWLVNTTLNNNVVLNLPQLTLSYYYKLSKGSSQLVGGYLEYYYNTSAGLYALNSYGKFIDDDQWHYISETKSDYTSLDNISKIQLEIAAFKGTIEVSQIKLEYGSATPWTPAPEDCTFGTTEGDYMGTLVWDKPYPSNDPKDYTWGKVKGNDAVSVRLVPDKVVVDTDTNGHVTATQLTNAYTTVEVKKGATAYDSFAIGTPTTSSGIGCSVSKPKVTVTSIGNDTTTGYAYGSGYIDIPVTVDGVVYKVRLTVETNIHKVVATLKQTTTDITASVTALTQKVDGNKTATDARLTVAEENISAKVEKTEFDALGTRVGAAESNITQNANSISTKVSQTDYNGNKIASLINQTATTVAIQASKINLVGAVTISSIDKSSVTPVALGAATPTDVTAAVNGIQIGGRNLLLSSKISKSGSSYNIGYWNCSRDFIVGETLTVTIKGNIPGSKQFGIWFNSGSYGGYALPKISDGVYSKTITVPTGTSTRVIGIYLINNQSAGDSWSFERIKLESGNKATDWTPAPEDVDSAISTAQTSANNANTAIANIVSDNMLSANEKGGERDRWNVIASEKSGIDAQATAYGITTEKTAYDTAFQTLATYLNNGTTWTSGIPNWITDANLSVNTAVDGTTYRSKWQGYFDAKTALLNAIYAKAKVLADNAQGSANTALTNAAAAQTTASNAATAASNAQTSANTANSAISDMTSDDKITAQEKQSMKTEWDSIVSEKTKNDTQADNFGVSRTTYDSAYSTLSTTIGTNLSNLTTTWDLGSGGGATLRSRFKAYYDARTDLLNAISTKAKALADAAQTQANTATTKAAAVQSQLTVLQESINTNVTEVSGLKTRMTSVEQTASGLTSTVAKINNYGVNVLYGVGNGNGWLNYTSYNSDNCGFAFGVDQPLVSPPISNIYGQYTLSFERWLGDNVAGGDIIVNVYQYEIPYDDADYTKYPLTNTYKVASFAVSSMDLDDSLNRYYMVIDEARWLIKTMRFAFQTTKADSRLLMIQVEPFDKPTQFNMGMAINQSQIKQTATQIEMKVKDCGIDIDERTINLKAENCNFIGADGLPYIKVKKDDKGMPHFIFLGTDGVTEMYDLGYTGLKSLITNAHDGIFNDQVPLFSIDNVLNNPNTEELVEDASYVMSVPVNDIIAAYKYSASYSNQFGTIVFGDDGIYDSVYYKSNSRANAENLLWLSDTSNIIPDGWYAKWETTYRRIEKYPYYTDINIISCCQISNGRMVAYGDMYVKSSNGLHYFTDENGNRLSPTNYTYIKDYVIMYAALPIHP